MSDLGRETPLQVWYDQDMSIKKRLKKLEEHCKNNGLRVTEPRLLAYRAVLEAKKPPTAYDVLDAMAKTLNDPKPPTAYRALEFLIENHFIHRIESLNAYVACAEDHHHRGSQFLICDHCGRVEEVHLCSLPSGLKKQALDKGFDITYWNAELHGCCASCNASQREST